MQIPVQKLKAVHSGRLLAEELMDFASQGWLGRLPRVLSTRQCPLCSSIRFVAAESSWPDGLLRLLMLRPVRCVNCWRRYYWFGTANKAAE
jgi:hypothetical protein